ncbi:PspC domain-containing protein [Pseudonocardia sp.]|uniref:PspC domain-containing protein n=1 Tax=Pseudonocardia sp. TaxID=60912 RepID=UPI003D107784
MDTHEPTPLRRSSNRLLGGVCAGLAERFGVDPLLVRIAVVVLGIFSSGLVLLAYLIAWVVIPGPAPSTTSGAAPTARLYNPSPVPVDPKQAWNAVGDELRNLVGAVRTPSPQAEPGREKPRSPLDAVDRAATEAGDRLRTPEVRESAGRLAEGLSTAVTSSVDEIGRKVKRST